MWCLYRFQSNEYTQDTEAVLEKCTFLFFFFFKKKCSINFLLIFHVIPLIDCIPSLMSKHKILINFWTQSCHHRLQWKLDQSHYLPYDSTGLPQGEPHF